MRDRHPKYVEHILSRELRQPVIQIPYHRPTVLSPETHALASDIVNDRRPSGLTFISGEPGSGKTTLAVECAYRWAASRRVVWWARGLNPTTLIIDLVDWANKLNLPAPQRENMPDTLALLQGWLSRYDDWVVVVDDWQPGVDIAELSSLADRGQILVVGNPLSLPNGAREVRAVGGRAQTAQQVSEALAELDRTWPAAAVMARLSAFLAPDPLRFESLAWVIHHWNSGEDPRGELKIPAPLAAILVNSQQRDAMTAALRRVNLADSSSPDLRLRPSTISAMRSLFDAAAGERLLLLANDFIDVALALDDNCDGLRIIAREEIAHVCALADQLMASGRFLKPELRHLTSILELHGDAELQHLSIPYARRALALEEEREDANRYAIGRAAARLGNALCANEQYFEAVDHLTKAFTIAKAQHGPISELAAFALNELVRAQVQIDRSAAKQLADSYYAMCLREDPAASPSRLRSINGALSILNQVYRELGEVETADAIINRVVEFRLSDDECADGGGGYGAFAQGVEACQDDLQFLAACQRARGLKAQGDIYGAGQAFTQLLPILLESTDPNSVQVLAEAGEALSDIGDDQGAVTAFQASICRAKEEDWSLYAVIDGYHKLAAYYHQRSDLQTARNCYTAALEHVTACSDPEPTGLATCHTEMAEFLAATGDVLAAIGHYEIALQLWRERSGDPLPAWRDTALKLARTRVAAGDPVQANALARQVERLALEAQYPDYDSAAKAAMLQGVILNASDDDSERAVAALNRAVEYAEIVHGPESYLAACVAADFGSRLAHDGQFVAARDHLQRAASILARLDMPKAHARVADVLASLPRPDTA